MNTRDELITTLEERFAEGSSRRAVGKLLITTDRPLNTRELSDMAGLSMGAVSGSLETLSRIFELNKKQMNGRLHFDIHTLDTSADEAALVSKSLFEVFQDSIDYGYRTNGYWKGEGYGSIQLA